MAAQDLSTVLLIECLEVGYLGIVNALVVDLRQVVELTALLLKLLAQGCILQFGQGTEVGILRMKGKDADAAIGIGIGPGMGGRGVVDG